MRRPQQGRIIRGRRGSSPRKKSETSSTGATLVTYIAKGLVEFPDAVDVSESPRGGGSVVELRVSMQDLGKVIGKSGRTAQAMRTLLQLSAKDGEETTLDIKD